MLTQPASLRSTVRQTMSFVAYVARNFPLFYFIIALSFVVLVLEYAATSLMIPLASSGGSGTPTAGGVALRFWRAMLGPLGMTPSQQTWLWLFFLLMTAALIFGYLQVTTTTLLGKRVHRSLSAKIFGHVVGEEPLTAVYTRSVGHYVTLAGDDTSRCGNLISSFLQAVVGACTALVALAVLYQFSGVIFSAVVVFLTVAAVTIALALRYILGLNEQATSLSRELNTVFIEALNSLRSIRSLHGEQFVCASYAGQITTYVRLLWKIEVFRTAMKSFPAILLLVVAAILLRPSSTLTMAQASLFAGTIIVIRIFASLGQCVTSGGMLLTDIRAIRDIKGLISESRDATRSDTTLFRGPIDSFSVNDIDFRYEGGAPILAGVTFRFEKGKTYAIIGPSGSGKSTLADIMLGLIRPDQGFLSVNDGALDASDFRGRMMLVEQQPKIFSTTLRENLLFGSKASDEQLWMILRLVDLEDTVKYLRNGLDTPLSYLGENFSGGQRQRIGIARALVRNPDILILDEATSAIDAATRALVVGNIRRHMRNEIIVFITHDPEIATLADEVLIVEKRNAPGDADGPPRRLERASA